MHAQCTGNGSIWGYGSDSGSPTLGIFYVRFKDNRLPSTLINVFSYCSRWSGSGCSRGCAKLPDVLKSIGESASRMQMMENNHVSPTADAWLAPVPWEVERKTVILDVHLGSSVLCKASPLFSKRQRGKQQHWMCLWIPVCWVNASLGSSPKAWSWCFGLKEAIVWWDWLF